MKPTPAIYYHTDAYDTSRPKLMGRHVAGDGVLRAMARHASGEALTCFSANEKTYAHFEARIADLPAGARRSAWICWAERERLAEVGGLFLPIPDIGRFAWQRRFGRPDDYYLCGLTHTTASLRAMEAIGDLLLAPLQPWDAVICTSRAMKATFEHILGNYADYLADRVGGAPRCPAELPVIPLGVDCDAFTQSTETAAARRRLRDQLRIGPDDVAVLFVGRLAYHAKAHPAAMYLALQAAPRETWRRVHLIQAGWANSEGMQKAFVEGARRLCPDVRCHFLDGRKPEVRRNVWFAADIFCSLSDNIQETFGITPIEAMAAGLPTVVSDWDGYKDTVRDGVDGFRIPTAMPAPGAAEDLIYRHLVGIDDYDHYVGYVGQCSAVDVPACTAAFSRLITDDNLRRRMGAAGRQRARECFDWKVIIGQYQALWAELDERRRRDAPVAPRRPGAPAHPLADDPTQVFASYPTAAIDEQCLVQRATADSLDQLRTQKMNTLARRFLLPDDEVDALLASLPQGGAIPVGKLTASSDAARRIRLQRSLGWLAKMGAVSLHHTPEAK